MLTEIRVKPWTRTLEGRSSPYVPPQEVENAVKTWIKVCEILTDGLVKAIRYVEIDWRLTGSGEETLHYLFVITVNRSWGDLIAGIEAEPDKPFRGFSEVGYEEVARQITLGFLKGFEYWTVPSEKGQQLLAEIDKVRKACVSEERLSEILQRAIDTSKGVVPVDEGEVARVLEP